jgi:hypothetical protein
MWIEHARTLERELAEATAEASHYMAVAQKATDELIFFRADNLKAHQMTCVAGLERDRLRAEVERLNEQCETNKRSISNAHTAIDESGILPPRDKTHQGLTPRVKSIIARAEKAEADNAKWQKLLLMSRDDREIDLISEIEEQARLLGMSGEREADLLGKLGRLESALAAMKCTP